MKTTRHGALEQNHPSFLYGPVLSRRLGFSLGVDVLRLKTCSMNCIYCQLGRSPKTTMDRRDYVPAGRVLDEIKAALASGRRIDAITFSGSGEPTLHAGIGKMIRAVKKMTKIPVVVLTNSSCLVSEKVRKELRMADIVAPSLDAASEAVFKKINRPHKGLTIDRIIDGLVRFRDAFKGKIWLEVMLVKGMNDGPAHLKKLKRAIARIRPDKVQLNTVSRPPAESRAHPLSFRSLSRVKRFLGGSTEIIADLKIKARVPSAGDMREVIAATVRRRPVTAEELSLALAKPVAEVRSWAHRLVGEGRLKRVTHKGLEYFESP
jgi:wyosine [tRNA(Phe)-imidazoG37] synthetase (radical SAM superfamily)